MFIYFIKKENNCWAFCLRLLWCRCLCFLNGRQSVRLWSFANSVLSRLHARKSAVGVKLSWLLSIKMSIFKFLRKISLQHRKTDHSLQHLRARRAKGSRENNKAWEDELSSAVCKWMNERMKWSFAKATSWRSASRTGNTECFPLAFPLAFAENLHTSAQEMTFYNQSSWSCTGGGRTTLPGSDVGVLRALWPCHIIMYLHELVLVDC